MPNHYFLWGRYKTWTLDYGLDFRLDSGLDYGLDFGLDYGLDYGQDFGLDSRTYKLTLRFLPVRIIQIPMHFFGIDISVQGLHNAWKLKFI